MTWGSGSVSLGLVLLAITSAPSSSMMPTWFVGALSAHWTNPESIRSESKARTSPGRRTPSNSVGSLVSSMGRE